MFQVYLASCTELQIPVNFGKELKKKRKTLQTFTSSGLINREMQTD